jgi:hypothetical protein
MMRLGRGASLPTRASKAAAANATAGGHRHRRQKRWAVFLKSSPYDGRSEAA